MIQMCHLKALNQVLITFCETAILECTLKVVGHFASWSHCALGCAARPRLDETTNKTATDDAPLPRTDNSTGVSQVMVDRICGQRSNYGNFPFLRRATQ